MKLCDVVQEKGSNPNSPGRGKTRISIAPNHSLLAALAEKNRMAQSSNSFSPLPSTVSKTLKVAKRVAHIPDVVSTLSLKSYVQSFLYE